MKKGTLTEKEKIQLKKTIISSYKDIIKIICNENRLTLLFILLDKEYTWSELLCHLKINPKSLWDAIRSLEKYDLLFKENDHYNLTQTGKNLCDIRFVQDIKQVFELTD